MRHNLFIHWLFFSTIVLLFTCKIDNTHISENPPSENSEWDKYGIPTEDLIKARTAKLQSIRQGIIKRSPNDLFNEKWTLEGPSNIGGRISAIVEDPSNPDIIFCGFSNGGIFKTTNGGKNWIPVFDKEITLSIGALAIDPKNSNIIYAGTGDPDINGNSYIGFGMYKSTDGGLTWTPSGLTEVRVINEIIIDPINSNILYVGAMGNPFESNSNRGFYKSKDGGLSWSKTLFVSDSSGISDIAINPVNPSILYAASYHRIRTAAYSRPEGPDSKIFKSTDQGEHWSLIMQGIPQTIYSRIAIDISASDPDILYARTVKNLTSCNGGYNIEGLYKSANGGDSWTRVAIDYSTLDCGFLGGFGWYFGKIAIDPKNPQHIYMLGVDLWSSLDGGITWLNVDEQSQIGLHADKHILIFRKNGNLLLGTDGGLYQYNTSNSQWADIENIPCTQFYRVETDIKNPSIYFGGAQDNGTSSGNKNSINSWNHVWGGDGFQTRFHNKLPDLVWYETQYGGISQYNRSTGDYQPFTNGITGTVNWDAPYFMSKFQPDSMYAASVNVFLNINPMIPNWKVISPDLTVNGPFPNRITPTISCLDESPRIQNKIISGTTNGNIWLGNVVTGRWTNVTNGLPQGYITAVKCSPDADSVIYVSFSNYRNNDNKGYLFKSFDNGNSWINIANSELLDQPVNDFVILPGTKDQVIIAGTVFGVYATVDAGISWRRLGTNMPIIPVNAVLYNGPRKELIAATFARSIQTYPLDNLTGFSEADEDNKLMIYPNPAKDYLHILQDIDRKQFNEYVIFRLDGTKVKQSALTEDYSISIETIPTGIYYLALHKENVWNCYKFIKI